MGMLMRRHRHKAAEALEQPGKSAKKDEWVAFALSTGLSEEDLKGLKKEEIIALFAGEDTPEASTPPAGEDAPGGDTPQEPAGEGSEDTPPAE